MDEFSAWHRPELAERGAPSPASVLPDQFAPVMAGVLVAAAVSLSMAWTIVAGGSAMGPPSLASPPGLASCVVPGCAVFRGMELRKRIGRRGTVPPAAPPVT